MEVNNTQLGKDPGSTPTLKISHCIASKCRRASPDRIWGPVMKITEELKIVVEILTTLLPLVENKLAIEIIFYI